MFLHPQINKHTHTRIYSEKSYSYIQSFSDGQNMNKDQLYFQQDA